MKKRTYRAKNVNKIHWDKTAEQLSGKAAVFAIDVVKEKQYALLTSVDNSVSELIWWNHPEQTSLSAPLFVARTIGWLLKNLAKPNY